VRTPRSIAGSYRPVVGNFRGPARVGSSTVAEEVVFYAPGTTADALWRVAPNRAISSSALDIDIQAVPFVADLDGDGWDDIIWYAPGTTLGQISFGGASSFTTVSRPVSGSYRVAIGDFDCDGRDEVLWHGPGTVTDRRWEVSAARAVTSVGAEVAGTFRLVVANLDGDEAGGHPCDDLVRYAPGTAPDSITYGGPSGAVVGAAVSGTYAPFAGDFDGDGRDEVFWYAPGSAGDAVWSVSAARVRTSSATQVQGTYAPVTGDLDGDATSDVVWFTSAPSVPLWWGFPSTP
jgi:hypothetical protein